MSSYIEFEPEYGMPCCTSYAHRHCVKHSPIQVKYTSFGTGREVLLRNLARNLDGHGADDSMSLLSGNSVTEVTVKL